MTDAPLSGIPSAWSAYLPILMGLCRAVLGALGSAGITWAVAVTDSQLEMALGAAMIIVAAGWSAWQKIQSVRLLRRTAASPSTTSTPALPL